MKKIYTVNVLYRVRDEKTNNERVNAVALKAFETEADAIYFRDWYKDVKMGKDEIYIWVESLEFVPHYN